MLNLLIILSILLSPIPTQSYTIYIPYVVVPSETTPPVEYTKPPMKLGVWIETSQHLNQNYKYIVSNSIVEISTLYNKSKDIELLKDYDLILGMHETDPDKIRYWASFYPEYIEVLNLGFLNEPEVYMSPREYADHLTIAYQIIKETNPNTIVIAGALINPNNGWWDEVQSYTDSYDAVSFHFYLHYPDDNFEKVCYWSSGIKTDKPIYLTETALRCKENCGADFHWQQMMYLRYLYGSNCNISMVLWYTLGGNIWENTDMVLGNKKLSVWYLYEYLLKNR